MNKASNAIKTANAVPSIPLVGVLIPAWKSIEDIIQRVEADGAFQHGWSTILLALVGVAVAYFSKSPTQKKAFSDGQEVGETILKNRSDND